MFDAELDGLAKTGRVAVLAVCVEHVFDFYRMGNFSLQVRHAPRDHVPGLGGAFPADRDLIELGLELAWRFVTTGQHEASTTAPIIAMLEGRPYLDESSTLSVAANGPIYGVTDSSMAITDQTPNAGGFALSRSSTGVSDLAGAHDPDEDAPAREERLEAVWQLKVGQLM